MKLWNALLRAFGLAEKEYHHIVDQFQVAVDDLKFLEDRKMTEASNLAGEIADKNALMDAANGVVRKARNTAAKIQAIYA